jgi:hypothetical protein
MKGTWQTTGGGSGNIAPTVAIIAAAVVIGSGAVSAIVHAIAVVIVVIGCTIALAIVGLVAGAVMVLRQGREHGAMLEATRPERLAAATARPQVAQAVAPAIEHHTHNHYGPEFHIYGAEGQDAAAVLIRKALDSPARNVIPGQARHAITKGE